MNAELCTIEKLFDSIETCHICAGQLALDDVEPTHCENCSSDCEGHDGDSCVPLHVLLREARQALRRLRQRRSQQLKLMDAFLLLEKQIRLTGSLKVLAVRNTDRGFAVTLDPFTETHVSKDLTDAMIGALNG